MKVKVSATGKGMYARFKCPGCGDTHVLNIDRHQGHPIWTYNGDANKPTFNPSVLATSGHYVQGYDGRGCWCDFNKKHPDKADFKCYRCHSWVRDGKIEFLTDSTHELAGQTVELPELEEKDGE